MDKLKTDFIILKETLCAKEGKLRSAQLQLEKCPQNDRAELSKLNRIIKRLSRQVATCEDALRAHTLQATLKSEQEKVKELETKRDAALEHLYRGDLDKARYALKGER